MSGVTDVVSVRLPRDTKRRLDALSERTRRPSAVYVREALEAYLEDLEDYYMAVAALERIRAGEPTYALEDVKADLGLD
ncbi:ribbon-helix-helix domain-containing protein [Gleimia hominis]|uniref:Ribbon-helix-helix domain-containing protein n=1 Tax=Gleimia hominis TaxID=595468 RepID=A0ABU3IAK2_9ACTO|nr:ribbon-helix-helix domain-containing protein [Gleimia hominis]MDT3767253.1 ribbon-helix-helix domain-containing protein [Gleimia hominis]